MKIIGLIIVVVVAYFVISYDTYAGNLSIYYNNNWHNWQLSEVKRNDFGERVFYQLRYSDTEGNYAEINMDTNKNNDSFEVGFDPPRVYLDGLLFTGNRRVRNNEYSYDCYMQSNFFSHNDVINVVIMGYPLSSQKGYVNIGSFDLQRENWAWILEIIMGIIVIGYIVWRVAKNRKNH